MPLETRRAGHQEPRVYGRLSPISVNRIALPFVWKYANIHADPGNTKWSMSQILKDYFSTELRQGYAKLEEGDFSPQQATESANIEEKSDQDGEDLKNAAMYYCSRWTTVATIIGLLMLTGLIFFTFQNQSMPIIISKRKALIIAGHKGQDHAWLSSVPQEWETFTYVLDDPLHVPSIPREQGYEAMAYLSFIIENYDNLPDYMVFIHGHNKAWHQPEPMSYLLQALNLSAVEKLGWVSLRCQLKEMCEPEGTRANMSFYITPNPLGLNSFGHHKVNLMHALHNYIFRPNDPWYNADDYDEYIGTPAFFAVPCCAQFAVAKEQALKRPVEFWRRVREPIEKDLEPLRKFWALSDDHTVEWWIGIGYETLWHYFFAKNAITCLPRDYCRNTIVQGRIHCDGRTAGYGSSQWYRNITCTLDEALPGTENLGLPMEDSDPALSFS